MSFRFRLGPFTFGRTGTRLSLWRRGTGVSIPLSGKGRSFGKLGIGPASWYFSGSSGVKSDNAKTSGSSTNGIMRLLKALLGIVFMGLGSVLAIGSLMSLFGGSVAPAMISGAIATLLIFFGARWFTGKRPDGAWRSDPATERQKSFANDLGIQYPENVTKGELSDMISKITGK
jgi:hypothetical protein